MDFTFGSRRPPAWPVIAKTLPSVPGAPRKRSRAEVDLGVDAEVVKMEVDMEASAAPPAGPALTVEIAAASSSSSSSADEPAAAPCTSAALPVPHRPENGSFDARSWTT